MCWAAAASWQAKDTALHFAAYNSDASCVDSLLKAGANVSLPLHPNQTLASLAGRFHPSSLSQHGKTVMDIAKEQPPSPNSRKVVRLLTPARAAALGLLQPLEALLLDADALRKVTAAAVTYCDAQGAASFADLVERASRLIAIPTGSMPSYYYRFGFGNRGPELWPCDALAYGLGGWWSKGVYPLVQSHTGAS